jgi:hypothetical protein
MCESAPTPRNFRALQNSPQNNGHSGAQLRGPNVPIRAAAFGRNARTLSPEPSSSSAVLPGGFDLAVGVTSKLTASHFHLPRQLHSHLDIHVHDPCQLHLHIPIQLHFHVHVQVQLHFRVHLYVRISRHVHIHHHILGRTPGILFFMFLFRFYFLFFFIPLHLQSHSAS